MKTFTKIAAALLLCASILPAVFAPSANAAVMKKTITTKVVTKSKMGGMPHMKMGMMKMGRKGGYVHATTFVNKNGNVVHRKGFYRHATKVTKTVTKTTTKMTGKKAM